MNDEQFLKGFESEMNKFADLIPKQVYKGLSDYPKRKLVEARDTIAEATKKTSTLPTGIKEKMIESAIDTAKGVAYEMARVNEKKDVVEATAPSVNGLKKKPPASL